MKKLSKEKTNNPEVAGTPSSAKLSKKQQKLVNYLSYFGKITKCVQLTPTKVRIQKAKGLEMFLKKQKEAELVAQGRRLSAEEITHLEEEYRFETFYEEIGNAQTVLNHLLGEALTGDKFRNLVEEAKEEALAIVNRQESFDEATRQAMTKERPN